MAKRPMTLLFDAGPLINGNLSGVGYYTKGTIEALAAAYPDDLRLIGHCFNFLGRKSTANLPVASNIRYVQSRLIPGKVLSLTRKLGFQIPFEFLIRSRGDVAFFPNFVSLPLLQKIPTLLTIPDLCFEDFPGYVQAPNRVFLQKFVPKSAKKAARVLAISEDVKNSAIKHYGLDPDKVCVTYIPVAPMPADQPQPTLVEGKYILFVSTLEPRKNFITLVRAYIALPDKLKEQYALVLAGGAGWHVEGIMAEIRKLQDQGENILTPGYVDEKTRAGLYQHASLFVMPSFYEGFGMPLLEAMDAGVPVLASDIDVFKEVGGSAAEYAKVNEPASFTSAMIGILQSEPRQKELIKAGRARVQEFSWPGVAKTIYEQILEVTARD